MIRKIIICQFLFCFLFVSNAFSQCVTDTTVKSPGFSPDSLPAAKTWEPYSQSITILTPRDTVITYSGNTISVKVDSIVVFSISGLPPGFNYQCKSPEGVFVWNEPRCLEIYGTTNQAGIYFLNIVLIAYAKWGTIPLTRADTMRNFQLVVNGSGSAKELNQDDAQELTFWPNPANELLFVGDKHSIYTSPPVVLDFSGRTVDVACKKEMEGWELDISSMKPGMYSLTVGRRHRYFQIIR